MNTFAVICLVLGCSVSTYAEYGVRQNGGNRQTCCSDYMGRRVRPGQSYYDGCNTCICGQNGLPSLCTLRYCGPNVINTGRLRYSEDLEVPGRLRYSDGPTVPALPVNRVLPVLPINAAYTVRPTAPVAPKYVPLQMRRYY